MIPSEWTAEKVEVEKIDVSPWEGQDKFCIVVHNVLSPEECRALIDFSEKHTYEPALINVGGGKQKQMSDVRNNDRFIHDDPVTMEIIWQRVLKALREKDPTSLDTLVNIPELNKRLYSGRKGRHYYAVGLNERMRYLRYDPGTYFLSDFDGAYVRSLEAGREREGEQSFVTFQLYLNEGFQGGATRFLSIHDETNHDEGSPSIWSKLLSGKRAPSNRPHYNVIPRSGSVLLFQHNCCHEGAVVIKGRKYAIRSDVMYSTKNSAEYSLHPIQLASSKTNKTGRSDSFDSLMIAESGSPERDQDMEDLEDALGDCEVGLGDYDTDAIDHAAALEAATNA